ncbi:MAG: polyribonucleotide nucleotidyltransferase [Deltaproteobacteria bacterium]|nr:polyribonucleotide nucleotidyltransferase [Deltaproteobacteria bacterium]MBI3294304.1 polyribonucleotide nucleotidyltransferase [Deltaproteobacteria bacterium]
MSVVEVSTNYGGRTLTLQTGKLAKQTDASVLARYGDTMVLVTVVSSKKLATQDFFPLTVDYQEKYYAAGRIPGGFFKREAKPSDKATLSARIIDRPIRPLFPEDYMFETNVVATVLSTDGVNEPDLVASIAASAALHISDIPWNGPVACGRVGCINGDLVMNFAPADAETTTLDLLVSSVRTGVVMVEGSAKEVSEKLLNDAIYYAHEQMQAILDLQDELKSKVGRTKREYEKPKRDETLKKQMHKDLWPDFGKAFAVREKLARYQALDDVHKKADKKFKVAEAKTEEDTTRNKLVGIYYEELKATYARELTINSKARIDGRAYDVIRPITCETGLLPRVHGSGLFTRGETQVLAAVTLGTADDEQRIDSISGQYQKTFMLHYNFPPFSVGEARPLRGPGRREIGHGFLAERALSFVMPSKEIFPYTIRLVSEVLESNGSSSMATVCSGSMALMDAGVPIPKPVAGVAMGLIKEGEKIAILSDILGDEDHLGDMDFKVCGTNDGVTAFQMDLKIGGVSRMIMEQALEQAKAGRLHILGEMNRSIDKPRESVSLYAPRIHTIKIKPEKVREVIGSGGKVIRGIIEQTGVKIDIEDDGSIHIASVDEVSAAKAIDIIKKIVEEAEPGRIYEGPVTRIADFGAFIEIIPGTEGLCHISELDLHRVRRVEDVVKIGEIVRVKCLEVEPSGKMRLSRKALLNQPRENEADDTGVAAEEGAEIKPTSPSDYFADSAAPEQELDNSTLMKDPEDRPLREARRISSRDRVGGGGRGGSRDRGPRGSGGGGRFDRGPRSEGSGGGRGGYSGQRGGGRDASSGPPREGGFRPGGRDEGRGGRGGYGDRDRGPAGGGREGGHQRSERDGNTRDAGYRDSGREPRDDRYNSSEPNFNDRSYQDQPRHDRGGGGRGPRGPRPDRGDRGDRGGRGGYDRPAPRVADSRGPSDDDRFNRAAPERGGRGRWEEDESRAPAPRYHRDDDE